MNRLTSIAAAFALGLLIAVPARAQQGTGELRGRVVDAQNAVLPGVTVVAKNEASGQFREVVSGADGSFFMSALTPGSYELSAQLSGFKRYQRGNVRVEVGKTQSIDVQLQVGGIEQEITVTAESPIVDTTTKQLGGSVPTQELQDVPSLNRNFTSYLSLLPGITSTISVDSFGADSIRVNGQATQNANYMLDGAGNNDNFNNGNGGAQAAHAGRSGPGVPAADQQLRRGVRLDVGRRRERRLEAGHQRAARHAVLLRSEPVDDVDGLLCQGEPRHVPRRGAGGGLRTPGEAESAAEAVGRKPRRPDHQEQAALLREPGAHRPGSRADDEHQRPPRPEHDREHARQRLELDGAGGPPDQREQHVGRPLAARDVAADQSAGADELHAAARRGRTGQGLDDRRHAELGDREHAGQHLQDLVHPRRRVLRQPGLLREGRSGSARTAARPPDLRGRFRDAERTAAWIRPISSTRPSRGSCPANAATTT